MGLEVDLAAPTVGDMRVALGRPEVGMPEHLLYRAQVGSAFEEVRRERMPEEVWVDASRLEPGALGELAEDQEGSGAGERASTRVEEELRPVAPVEMGTTERQVAAHRFRRRATEWHEPFLPALADHADDALLEGDAVLLEPDGLRDTQPGAVEELHERPIAQGPRSRAGRSVDEPLRLRRRQGPR
jgi:hypothetical protein